MNPLYSQDTNNIAAVTTTEPHLQLTAQRLAKQYLLPLIEISEKGNFDFILVLTAQGLILQDTKNKSLGTLQIDFLKGKIAYRLRHLQNQKQLLAKAIGAKTHPKADILDLTAGLGNDGFVLAQLGFSVTLLERSPMIATLLDDGLHRALKNEKYSKITLQLIHTDAFIYLNTIQTNTAPDIIYLDPMYPHSNKSALAKKEMRLLRKIVGNDTDAESLLPLALKHAQKRVVVKRPRKADFLAELRPHHSIFGKQHRFDIYLTHNNR
jgi:16S rRNA (guanine1516-N2)-methyltransferase